MWTMMEATVPVTRKPEGIRMGKGKGNIEFYAAPVRPGQVGGLLGAAHCASC